MSECFCHTKPNALSGPAFFGGVLSCNQELDELAFAFFLQYLLEVVIKMLVANETLQIKVTGDSQFDEAMRFWERVTRETDRARPAHWGKPRPSENSSENSSDK